MQLQQLTTGHIALLRKYLHMCFGCTMQSRAIARRDSEIPGLVPLTLEHAKLMIVNNMSCLFTQLADYSCLVQPSARVPLIVINLVTPKSKITIHTSDKSTIAYFPGLTLQDVQSRIPGLAQNFSEAMLNSVPSIKKHLEDNNLMATGKPLIFGIYTTDKHGTFGASIMEQLAITLMKANKASVRCLSSANQAGETSTMFDEEMFR